MIKVFLEWQIDVNICAQKTACCLNTDLCGRSSMPLEEPFTSVKNKSSTETVQSAIILPISYLTGNTRILIKHMVIFS